MSGRTFAVHEANRLHKVFKSYVSQKLYQFFKLCKLYELYNLYKLYEIYKLCKLYKFVGCISCINCIRCISCIRRIIRLSCISFVGFRNPQAFRPTCHPSRKGCVQIADQTPGALERHPQSGVPHAHAFAGLHLAAREASQLRAAILILIEDICVLCLPDFVQFANIYVNMPVSHQLLCSAHKT